MKRGSFTPRLNSNQRDSIASPADGLVIFNTTTGFFNYWFQNSWYQISAICTPPNTFSSHPVPVLACSGDDTSFSVSATGFGLNYQWQISTDAGATWTNLTNGGVYSGVQSSTLSLTGVSAGLDGNLYRAYIQGLCSSDTSGSASLNIVPTATAVSAGSDQTLAACSSASLSGSNPGALSGQWSIVSGGGGTFGNASQANTTFTPNGTGSYTLRWTVSNSCGVGVSDDVNLTFEGKQVFSYTGANQTFTVPSCVDTIFVKMWGAGGGGRTARGGAGGYTEGYIAVTPGQSYTVVVGGGGDLNYTIGSYEYGGGGWTYSDGGAGGGSGGGRSAFRNSSNSQDLMTAGGGGGGYLGGNDNYGGDGGGNSGANGQGSGSGSGGTTSSGGAGGSGNGGTAQSGIQYRGGHNTSGWAGGGGGGGYFGGGGASGVSSDHGGGGGGSGFIGGSGVHIAQTLQGSNGTPPMTGDSDYAPGIGDGNLPNGGNGRVVIAW